MRAVLTDRWRGMERWHLVDRQDGDPGVLLRRSDGAVICGEDWDGRWSAPPRRRVPVREYKVVGFVREHFVVLWLERMSGEVIPTQSVPFGWREAAEEAAFDFRRLGHVVHVAKGGQVVSYDHGFLPPVRV